MKGRSEESRYRLKKKTIALNEGKSMGICMALTNQQDFFFSFLREEVVKNKQTNKQKNTCLLMQKT